MIATYLAEKALLPDSIIRWGIRNQLKERIKSSYEPNHTHYNKFIDMLKNSPIAIETQAANEQHYEVPSEFFIKILGPRLKYSCCQWDSEQSTLQEAEESSLKQVCERAEIQDGMSILDLGCGWGSFSLWAAEKYPNSEITSVSNSNSQRIHIESQAKLRKLTNITVKTEDINHFEMDQTFDRIVSIEMFEHLRNYQKLFSKLANFLNEEGQLFVHIFNNRRYAYSFEDENPRDWMARYFFAGGIMPSHDLFHQFDDDLSVVKSWKVNGVHYQKTLDAWLSKIDQNEEEILSLFNEVYGTINSKLWLQRWRLFHLVCSELFGYKEGEDWAVTHYLFKKTHSNT